MQRAHTKTPRKHHITESTEKKHREPQRLKDFLFQRAYYHQSTKTPNIIISKSFLPPKHKNTKKTLYLKTHIDKERIRDKSLGVQSTPRDG